DGASSDRTREIAHGDAIIFLHADTTLPAGACAAVAHALANGAEFGGFRIRFEEDLFRLRYVAFMVNTRTRVTKQPWGDQAQFVRRAAFLEHGGYREIPIMEDYELATRMKRRVLLPLAVTTSGRRFLQRGVVRTSVINWLVIAGFHFGVSPARLAALYRR
ncbi:MAG TPA: glycosyltransferase, partial [Thermoanaerobaculia bacterium]